MDVSKVDVSEMADSLKDQSCTIECVGGISVEHDTPLMAEGCAAKVFFDLKEHVEFHEMSSAQ